MFGLMSSFLLSHYQASMNSSIEEWCSAGASNVFSLSQKQGNK